MKKPLDPTLVVRAQMLVCELVDELLADMGQEMPSHSRQSWPCKVRAVAIQILTMPEEAAEVEQAKAIGMQGLEYHTTRTHTMRTRAIVQPLNGKG